MQTDDMFAKYARTDDSQTGVSGTQRKRVNVHYSDVDLTATNQDHIQYTQPEVVEGDLPSIGGHERKQRIINKYNRHSREVLRSQRVTNIKSTGPDTADLTLSELEEPAAPGFVPLQLNIPRTELMDGDPTADVDHHGITWSMGELSSTLTQCFPSASVAQLVLTTDTHRMATTTEESRVAMQAAIAGGDGRVSLTSNGGSSSNQHKQPQLSLAFINSHRQRYEMQTELLRHFYAAERQIEQNPQARERCRRIADKLQSEVNILTEMKRGLRDKENSHKQERFLQAMLDQLHRALDVWERVVGE